MFKYKFKFRGFVSLLTTFSFLISLVSGIVLYFTPQGKIANWTNWTFWGLDKHTWGALHINSSLLFFLIVGVHIYYNWKLLWAYIKKRAQLSVNLKWELAITLGISLYLILASIYDVQPFKQVMRWNDTMKGYWAQRAEAEPPVPHAELFTVEEFCQKLNISQDVFEEKLTEKGWTFKVEQSIEEIAKQNNISPADIYRQVRVTSSTSRGSGWGRMTIEQVCQQHNISVDTALFNLKKNNIPATADDNIRALATQSGERPSKIVDIITENSSTRRIK